MLNLGPPVLTVVVTLALAQAANPYLDGARVLARELKFAEAIAQLRVARQVPDLDPAQRIEVLELLAKCHVAEGNRPDAEAAFTELLALEPERELDRETTSPKILAVFDQVKRRLFPEERVSLVEENAPFGRVRARIVDPFRRVSAAQVVVRRGEGPWEERPLTLDGRALDVPTPLATTEAVSWFLQLKSATGEVLATLATAEAPRVVEPASLATPRPGVPAVEPSPPPTKVAGVVATVAAFAAVGVGTALQLSSQSLDRAARDSSRPPGDWADTARAAHAEAVTQASWSIGMFVTGGAAAVTAAVLFAW